MVYLFSETKSKKKDELLSCENKKKIITQHSISNPLNLKSDLSSDLSHIKESSILNFVRDLQSKKEHETGMYVYIYIYEHKRNYISEQRI